MYRKCVVGVSREGKPKKKRQLVREIGKGVVGVSREGKKKRQLTEIEREKSLNEA